MENFTFYSPTFFVFGKDTENQAGTYVKRFGGTKVLIHFGGKSAKSSGLLNRVEKSLAAENIPYVSLGGVKPNPRSFLISIGMPKNFAELGAKEEDIPKLVNVLCRGDGRQGSISGFVTLNEEDCTKIYKMMV